MTTTKTLTRHTPRANHIGTPDGTYRHFGYSCSCGWTTTREYASTQTASNAWIRHADKAVADA